jgi:hypothetical protein
MMMMMMMITAFFFSETLSKDGSVAEGWKHPDDKVT